MELLKKTTLALAAAVAVGLAPAVARANTITVSLASVTVNGANFNWNYQIAEDALGRITNGPAPTPPTTPFNSTEGQIADYFTLYDISGFVGAIAPAGWAFITQNVGVTPVTQGATDNPAVINVTFYRTGAPIIGDNLIAGFVITSNFSLANAANGNWTSEDTHNGGTADGTTDQAIGHVLIPTTTVPEPATMFLVGTGLLGLGAKFRRRRSNA